MGKPAKAFVRYLPVFGCISTGIIYATIGVVAMLSFLKFREGGADESSILVVMNNFILGKLFVWVILTGTVSYTAWRFYETVADPYGYGKDIRGIA